MAKSDLVLGAVGGYKWEQIQVWALSLLASGFSGVGGIIVYDDNKDVIEKMTGLGFQVIRMPLKGSVFNQRFYDFATVINDEFRYVVVTDVRDVYFQKNPIEWLEENLEEGDFVATSEGLQYKNESWNADNLMAGFPDMYKRLKEKCVYNVGVLAGEAQAVSDLCFAIGSMAKSASFGVADQSGFNILLDLEPYKSHTHFVNSEDGFACQAGTFADPTKIDRFRQYLLEPEPKMDEEGIKTNGGKLYHIIHQYDRVPEWEAAIRKTLQSKLDALNAKQNPE